LCSPDRIVDLIGFGVRGVLQINVIVDGDRITPSQNASSRLQDVFRKKWFYTSAVRILHDMFQFVIKEPRVFWIVKIHGSHKIYCVANGNVLPMNCVDSNRVSDSAKINGVKLLNLSYNRLVKPIHIIARLVLEKTDVLVNDGTNCLIPKSGDNLCRTCGQIRNTLLYLRSR
jgi:hypothetical protein